jgi:uncharacterized membrane protein
MGFVTGTVIGWAIVAVMILATKSLPVEVQGSGGMLIGFIVGCGLGFLRSDASQEATK